ncbi:TatD family hydrolase [Patescibacteria group bacterium]|nr:TatD family hydrolase [Patescibacteria group bacterium]
MLIDSHCHIQFNAYKDDYDEVIKRCVEKDVVFNTVGTQKETSKKAVEFAEKYDNVYATIGLHPIHTTSTEVDEEEIAFTSREEKFDYEFYKKLASHPKVIAIGECGIELFHLPNDVNREAIIKKHSESFLQQAKLAQELDLPMSIHVRDAYDEMYNLLKSKFLSPPYEGGVHPDSHRGWGGFSGVIHCFTGNWTQAQKFLDLGLYLGITGIITFPAKKTDPKPSLDLLEVVKNCPIDRILIETDAPYLAPQAYRSQRCEPWMVEEVAKKIAEIKGLTFEEVKKITVENTKRLFTKIR